MADLERGFSTGARSASENFWVAMLTSAVIAFMTRCRNKLGKSELNISKQLETSKKLICECVSVPGSYLLHATAVDSCNIQ